MIPLHEIVPGTKVRVWDNGGETVNRYTVVLHGQAWPAFRSNQTTFRHFLGTCSTGRSVSQFGELAGPEGKHLGRQVRWTDIPEPARRHILARLT